MTIFGELHAQWYDRWHEGKDYPREVEQLRGIIEAYGSGRDLIDLGCGTGRHLELLAAEGYRVVGVDRSAVMVAQAQARLAPYEASVVQAEPAAPPFGEAFDLATMMFSAIGYQVTDEAMAAALAAVHRVLRPGGLFLFDVLDAAAILRDGPQGEVTLVRDGDERLLRATTGAVHRDDETYEFTVRLWLLRDEKVIEHAEESHVLRFFLRRELDLLLSTHGFALLGQAPLAGGRSGSARTWSRLVWARRI